MTKGVPARTAAGRSDGFTLIEVLVATAIFTSGLVSVAELVRVASRANDASRYASHETALASQKLDELRSVDAPSLPRSPVETWVRSAPGSFEFLDSNGSVLMPIDGPPDSASYIRRWSVLPLDAEPAGAVIVEVSVGRVKRAAIGGAILDASAFDTVRLVGVKSRLVP